MESSYLGDGVYASHDGYHILLDLRAQATRDHTCVIALDSSVYSALVDYVEAIRTEEAGK